MSTEIFPTNPLVASEFIDKLLPGFVWAYEKQHDAEGKRVRRLVHERTRRRVFVYIGNGPFREERGYRADAVWFEAFAWNDTVNELFESLGDILDCNFVTEIGEEVSIARRDNWDEALLAQALRSMQKTPGSTSRYFRRPREMKGYAPCDPGSLEDKTDE